MLDIQLGRRNLSPIQRIAVTEKYRPIYEKQAKENLKEGGRKGGLANSSKPSQNSSKASSIDNNIDVRAKLAKTAGVSTDTYSKGKKILDSDDEELKREVLFGEKSINAGYREADNKGKEQQETLKEVESKLALIRKSIGGKGGFKDVPNSAQVENQGRARDKVAKNVGLRMGKNRSTY